MTLDTPVKLPKSHFRDMDELTKVLLQWKFEQELNEELQAAKKLLKSWPKENLENRQASHMRL